MLTARSLQRYIRFFLQRWRLSLIVQATTLNQQLLEEEREQLLSEVQERMTLSGQLEPILADNNTAAGRLWDMSAGQLKRGDYQLIVKYGEFLKKELFVPLGMKDTDFYVPGEKLDRLAMTYEQTAGEMKEFRDNSLGIRSFHGRTACL